MISGLSKPCIKNDSKKQQMSVIVVSSSCYLRKLFTTLDAIKSEDKAI